MEARKTENEKPPYRLNLKTREGRKEEIRGEERKEAVYAGFREAVERLGLIITVSDVGFKLSRKGKKNRSIKLPESFSFSQSIAMALALGRRTSHEISDYIVEQYEKSLKK